MIKTNTELNQKRKTLASRKLYKKELEKQFSQIINSNFYKFWQKCNNIKKFILMNKKKDLLKKIFRKALNYYYLYKKNPKKFKIIKSFYKSDKNPIIVNYIGKNFNIENTEKKIDVIIPWYGDKNIFNLIPNIIETDSNCLSKLFVINDGYPNIELSNQLENFIKNLKNKKIVYVKQEKNKGFVGTVNNGFSLIKNDCVILNSDTITTKNWLKKISDVAESDSKIATITPLSNNATIFSVPKFLEQNEDIDYEKTNYICEKTCLQKSIKVPTGHGYCMFIRKKYLDKYGIFDEKTFGKGYGEENDICMRFSKHGLKNLALLNTYIAHLESQSFGEEKRLEQIKNNYPKLLKKYPSYDKTIKNFIKINPLKNIQELIIFFKKNYSILEENFILIITHTNPYKIIGGVEIETSNIIEHLNNKYPNKSIILYFYDQTKNQLAIVIIKNGIVIKQIRFNENIDSKNILIWIIKTFKIKLTIIEHLMYHSSEYGKILKNNNIKSILFIHDFYYFCPKADLINNKNVFCKYESNKELCEKCLLNKINISNWREENKDLINKYSDDVIFNSEFTKDKYLELFNIKSDKKFKISYPE